MAAPKPIVWSRDPKADSAFIADYSAPGMPAGYRLRIDPQAAYKSALRYSRAEGSFAIRAGPGHIAYTPRDTASGSYTVTATVTQRARSKLKDAYGVFVGGQSLTTAKQAYGYFLIRESGPLAAGRHVERSPFSFNALPAHAGRSPHAAVAVYRHGYGTGANRTRSCCRG